MTGAVRKAARGAWLAFALQVEATLARLRSRLVGRRVKALLVESEQGRFLARPEDWTVGGLLARTGTYGTEEIERILSLTTPDSRVLIVGAHIGAVAIPVSRKVAHVTAIEANPDTFELLALNLQLNGCANAQALHLAAGDQDGEIEFLQSRTNSGGSKRLPVTRRRMYFYDRPQITRVRCARLDDVLPGSFDVILMDIEGSEYFALKGMPRLVSQARHLISEFLPHHFRYVAGVTASDFVALVAPHFDRLFIPSRNETVTRQEFLPLLNAMFEADVPDDGIIFSKS